MKREHLFVYGSLAPDASMGKLLARAGGTWHDAKVKARYLDRGWSTGQGYPAIVLDENAAYVHGKVLSSHDLHQFWTEIDTYEGVEYQRVQTPVELADGRQIMAHVYVLHPDLVI